MSEAIIKEALSKSDLFYQALCQRPESLARLLPYEEFLADGSIFLQKDGSLGVIFKVDLLEHEPLAAHQIIEAVESLKPWFTLDERFTLQVTYEQAQISAFDQRWADIERTSKEGYPVSSLLFDTKVERLKEAALAQSDLCPLERQTYVALRYFPKVEDAKAFRTGHAPLYRSMKENVRELGRFRQAVDTFELNSKFKLSRLSAGELLDVLRRFFNPRTFYAREFARHNPTISLSEQISYVSSTLDHSGIEREGIKSRTISLKTSPSFAYPGGMAYFTRLKFPFRMVLNFSFPTKASVKRFFDVKEFFLQNTPSAKARRQREDILNVQEKLARDDKCLFLTCNVTVDGKSEQELDRYAQEVIRIFHHELECETIVENDIGLGLCLLGLPLNYSPRADHSTQRAIRILRSDVIRLIPVFDSFRGLKVPKQLYLSRENQLIRFSLTENPTSNHTVVLADTGSGKSAFVIDCIQAAKRQSPEPLVFVIDKKSSYRMMSEYFDANLTEFSLKHEVPFSPFRGVYDDDKFAFLTNFIAYAAKLMSASFNLESEHLAAITKALKLAYAKKRTQIGLIFSDGELVTRDSQESAYLTMDDFIEELSSLTAEVGFENYQSVIEALSQKLAPFYGDGYYAGFFKGTDDKKPKSKLFYIYDLDALDSDPKLQALMTMAVVEEIRQTIKLPEHDGRGGFIVLEELGMIGGDNPIASRFIKDAAETFRKLGYWLISLTPRPQNYFELEAGRAMWSVADNFVFLKMSDDNVRYLMEHSSFVDPVSGEIIKSLRTLKGQYAEVYYMNKTKDRLGAFRFHPTPFDLWLAPTNVKDAREAKKALKTFGDDKWKALEYLAKNFPTGV